jgi:hypothetical protein
VVTHGSQQARGGDQGADPLGGLRCRGQRFLHEERHPRGQHGGLGHAVRERRHADIRRIEPGGQQLANIRERPAAGVAGQRRRRVRDDIGDPSEVNIREAAEHPRMPTGHIPGADQTDPADVHASRAPRSAL